MGVIDILRVAIPALSLLVAVILGYLNWRRKVVGYEVKVDRLLNVDPTIRKDVRILYQESEVRDVSLVSIKIGNLGNQPVATSDFESPFEVRLPAGSQILSFYVKEQMPEDLPVRAEETNQAISVNPLLLNNGDYFVLNILASGVHGEVKVLGRINGVKALRRGYVDKMRMYDRLSNMAFYGMLLVVLMMIIGVAALGTGVIAYGFPAILVLVVVQIITTSIFIKMQDKSHKDRWGRPS